MRPPRIAIIVLFLTSSIFLFCRSLRLVSATSTAHQTSVPKRSSSLTSLFSFNAPFTIFPPNAAISLTDDNSTIFAARPAAFGVSLPASGLSGQLWVGGGFSDDPLQGDGELGCSDAPDWEDGMKSILRNSASFLSGTKSGTAAGKHDLPMLMHFKRTLANRQARTQGGGQLLSHPNDDGTDDHLHLHEAYIASSGSHTHIPATHIPSHADIQSIQEAAEITDKVVLLSRGGCGFIWKVRWAQRRGAKAVIVGDNQKGGSLIQMFGKGDTSDITIPSVFTARITAVVLSSLSQPGNPLFGDGVPGQPKNKKGDKLVKNKPGQVGMATENTAALKTAKTAYLKPSVEMAEKRQAPYAANLAISHSFSWVSWLFGSKKHPSSSTVDHDNRPQSNGGIDWISEAWTKETREHNLVVDGSSKELKNAGLLSSASSSTPKSRPDLPIDTFRIGVHDWRDPDQFDPNTLRTSDSIIAGGLKKAAQPVIGVGGTRTPGSGEYSPENTHASVYHPQDGVAPSAKSAKSGSNRVDVSSATNDEDDEADSYRGDTSALGESIWALDSSQPTSVNFPEFRQGLWVTVRPTSTASPFLDTLLLLVVSPLVTLVVVYTLLIIKARIRRRRWRAPKSIIEQLPVRTYHTVAPSPIHSPRHPSPVSTSPATPLLQASPPRRHRPRSRTTTGIPEIGNRLSNHLPVDMLSRMTSRVEHEKPSSQFSSEWRKHMSRQVECVVCLEEYIDGVSRVMSLPCGHEFHAECITPWLTTQRRTCPICKGDVVRSLAHGSSSNMPRYEPYNDDSDGDVDIEASLQSDALSDEPILDAEPNMPTRHSDRRAGRDEGWNGFYPNSPASGSRALSGSSELGCGTFSQASISRTDSGSAGSIHRAGSTPDNASDLSR